MIRRATPRVLVTGSTGFFGRHVVDALLRKGFDPIATGRATSRSDRILDVTCGASVRRVVEKVRPDFVVNCAAYGVDYRDQDLHEAIGVNIVGSLTLLEAAADAGVSRFLHVGSCFEYGSCEKAVREDARLDPHGIYGITKAAASSLLIERADDLGIPLLVVRPFGMWGPGEGAHRLVPQIIRACRREEPLDLTPCDVIRDYSYVEDLARDLVELVAIDDWGSNPIINLASGRAVLLRDFVLRIANALDGASLMRFGRRPHRRDELVSLYADVELFKRIVGETSTTTTDMALSRMDVGR